MSFYDTVSHMKLTCLKSLMKTKIKHIVLVLLIVILAAFLRMYRLGEFPPGLYPDEAMNTTDAIRAMNTGHYLLYYSNNNGREGLFMNLIAMSFRLFGTNIVTLRMVSAVIGTLTVVAIYFLGRELFGRRTGLIASFLVAVSYWHINFSRISFRAIMVPLILAASCALLFKAYNLSRYADSDHKERSRAWLFYLMAGLIFGIGFHTYIAFRIAPAVIIVFFLAIFLPNIKMGQKFMRQSVIIPFALFFLGCLITASPILHHFLIHPEHLNARQNDNSISVLDPANNQGKLLASLAKTFGQTFGALFYRGDLNWRHNLPPNPALSPFAALMFLVGTAIFIGKFFIDAAKTALASFNPETRTKDSLVRYGTVLAWLIIMLSPAFLTVEGVPHALRSIGSLPAVYLIAAVPISWLFSLACPWSVSRNKALSILGNSLCHAKSGILICALFLTFFYTYVNYFYVWGPSYQAAAAFEKRLVNIGEYMTELEQGKTKYLIVNHKAKVTDLGFPVSLEPIHFFTYKKANNIVYLLPEQIDAINADGNFEIILQRRDDALIQELTNKFSVEPKEIFWTPGTPDTSFMILKKKPAIEPALESGESCKQL